MLISRALIIVICSSFVLLFSTCDKKSSTHHENDSTNTSASTTTLVGKPTLFTLLTSQQTNIDFSNTLHEGPNTNILMYEYFYNGGGVATGDLNGDGLMDIYFTSNMDKNRMYLNLGKMKFQDVTLPSGAGGNDGPWKTGVTFVDINGDSKPDIYVCHSGAVRDENRANQLFINEGNDDQGIPHFSEQARQYGLASIGYSNQAYFFDYDRDGDLDVLLLNHNPNSLPILNEVSTAAFLKKDDVLKGVRLYKQTKGHFNDVTIKAGISGSALTYGLGVGIADLNNDGWQDFYISNDYAVPDYLYINNHNGTFTDKLQASVGHNSQFSMGNDVGDINNDGWQDIITLDMLPEDNHRQKLLLAPDNYAKFDLNVRTGFGYQYMRNMFQLNNGNGTFSEIGQFAGISNTDWSWAALLADYNNDGWKDLFVTNGYLRDYTNLDFIKYMDDYVKAKGRLKREDVLELVSHMPASNVVNYIFANKDGTSFSNKTMEWGMNRASNSNGAAYADLDNDGDLDLVVNNVNQPALVYQNESSNNAGNHYLQLKLQGDGLNTQGIGAKVVITSNGMKQYVEQMIARGYLSSVSPMLHVGLGTESKVDTLVITWLSGKQQMLTNLKADQVLTLSETDAKINSRKNILSKEPLFKEVASVLNYQNSVLAINDFKRQPLMISQFSNSAFCMVNGDVTGDGLEDVYVGGGNGQSAALFIQQRGGEFIHKAIPAFEEDKLSVDVEAVFFDANNDGYPDLYVASGGYHTYEKDDALLQDRLYINDGRGNFSKNKNALPNMRASKGCVAISDVNHDGHPDIFVGGRVIPGRYPETPQSYLLINDGKGNFSDQTSSIATGLQKLGMITDAVWIDINQDKTDDLIVVGEWMPVSVFVNVDGKLQNETEKYFDKTYSGWWNTITSGDFNKDGKADLIVGNVGLNTQFNVSDQQPAEMFFKDFDNNGSVDPFFCYYVQGKSYPYVTRDEMLEQIGGMRKLFTTYSSYADITLTDIYNEEELKSAGHLQANHLETTLFINGTDGKFMVSPLPVQVQYSPVYTITVLDYDKDGNDDVLLCGNNSNTKLRLGKFDANYGVLLKGNGKGNFQYINQVLSGFNLRGDVRSVIKLNKTFLFGSSQKSIAAYKLK